MAVAPVGRVWLNVPAQATAIDVVEGYLSRPRRRAHIHSLEKTALSAPPKHLQLGLAIAKFDARSTRVAATVRLYVYGKIRCGDVESRVS
jgi:hypothetical protein